MQRERAVSSTWVRESCDRPSPCPPAPARLPETAWEPAFGRLPAAHERRPSGASAGHCLGRFLIR